MDIQIVKDSFAASMAGSITFPEVVQRLSATGTERYRIDLIAKQHVAYGLEGDVHCDSFDYDGPDVPKALDTEAVEATIRAIQKGQIAYLTFLERIMRAGCCHYEVYISGRQAIYFGRDGQSHVEPFPNLTR